MQTAGIPARLRAAWRRLPGEQRLAAGASLALGLTMLLPWYQLTARAKAGGLSTTSLSAFEDFSWVEAAVLLVAVAVLALLFARAERHSFHLPGGDGTVVLGAGSWTAVLLLWRAFDKPGGHAVGAVGLDWGFLFAFAASGALAYGGWRIRAIGRPEPRRERREPRAPAPAPPAPPPAPEPPTRVTEPITATTRAFTRRAGPPDSARPVTEVPAAAGEPFPLTAAHGSEEPLSREDLD